MKPAYIQTERMTVTDFTTGKMESVLVGGDVSGVDVPPCPRCGCTRAIPFRNPKRLGCRGCGQTRETPA